MARGFRKSADQANWMAFTSYDYIRFPIFFSVDESRDNELRNSSHGKVVCPVPFRVKKCREVLLEVVYNL